MVNPWDTTDYSPIQLSKYPSHHDHSWRSLTLAEFYQQRDSLPVSVPVMARQNFTQCFLNFGLGNFAMIHLILWLDNSISEML